MATALVTQWRVAPGRRAEFIQAAGEAKKIHEGLGGRVRMFGATAAGTASGTLSYVLEFDDVAAYAPDDGLAERASAPQTSGDLAERLHGEDVRQAR